jgi:hypothetical protein
MIFVQVRQFLKIGRSGRKQACSVPHPRKRHAAATLVYIHVNSKASRGGVRGKPGAGGLQ